ncbi:MAG: hypothetical protein AAFY36_18405, partial [Bacteroidota bacterium]
LRNIKKMQSAIERFKTARALYTTANIPVRTTALLSSMIYDLIQPVEEFEMANASLQTKIELIENTLCIDILYRDECTGEILDQSAYKIDVTEIKDLDPEKLLNDINTKLTGHRP